MKVSLRLWLALTLIVAGCKSPAFTHVASTPASVPEAQLAQPVCLAVVQRAGPALPRLRGIVNALKTRRHTIVLLFRKSQAKRPDYILEPTFRIVGWPCPKLNLLVAWMVGPLFGAPGWAGLQYDYEVETILTLTRPGVPAPIFEATLKDTYELAYTSNYYAAMIYGIDGGVVTGFQSAFDELSEPEELEPVEAGFLKHEALKAEYERRVVDTIENAIAADRADAPPE